MPSVTTTKKKRKGHILNKMKWQYKQYLSETRTKPRMRMQQNINTALELSTTGLLRGQKEKSVLDQVLPTSDPHPYHLKPLKICTWALTREHTLIPCALTREHTLIPCAPNENSSPTAPLDSPIRALIVHMKKLCILVYPECDNWRFSSDCANAQADLNLR